MTMAHTTVHKHTIRFWLILLVIFLVIFLLSFASLKTGSGMINIMPPEAEDYSFMLLSLIGIIKAVYELMRGKHI
jgi:hypothetical protein